jgi:HSP20 family protein
MISSPIRQWVRRWLVGHPAFERRIPVDDVDQDKIAASFKNGVLTVSLPKLPTAQQKVKRIAINGK